MARIGSFYGLCPLIDQKSLLGISSDITPGYAIVTLGKNIAIKYKLSDQKQIHSWSTKERFTCAVIYDHLIEQYVGVFNYNSIGIFGSDCESLDSIKKHKFQVPIHTIVAYKNDKSIVIFKNGTISSLKYALEMRKQKPQASILEQNDVILDHMFILLDNNMFIGLLIKTQNGDLKFNGIPLHNTNCEVNIQEIITVKLVQKNSNVTLSGYVLTQEDSTPVLLTLWSDGKLYSLILKNDCEVPGTFVSIIQPLCCTLQVAMIPLSLSYVAMFGANANQEGSSLLIYNTHFHVTQCKQPFKLSSTCSKIWDVSSNLLFPVGYNLAVVPYHLATEQLAALVGSHVGNESSDDPDITVINKVDFVDWGYKVSNEMDVDKTEIPAAIEKDLKQLVDEGYSEMNVVKEILPRLMDKKDLNSINYFLNNFKEISDQLLVQLLSFSITIENFAFDNTETLEIEKNNLGKPLQPLGRFTLVNKILSLPFSDVLILSFLRRQLNFSEAVILLQHICVLLSNDKFCLPNMNFVQSENKVVLWGSLLLDAHYQGFLLVRDETIITLLKSFRKLVQTNIKNLNNYINIIPLLEMIKRGKNIIKKEKHKSKFYSIEQVMLY